MNAGLVILSCIIYLRIVEYVFSAVSSAHFDYVYKCSHTKIKTFLGIYGIYYRPFADYGLDSKIILIPFLYELYP